MSLCRLLLTCNKRTCYTIDKIMKKQMSKKRTQYNTEKNTHKHEKTHAAR